MNTTNKKNILLVEDEAIVSISTASILTNHGYRVVPVYDGQEAVDAIDRTEIDLILMDIELGDGKMDGTEAACRILRKHTVPIVFHTSHAEKEMHDRVKNITRYGYVLKGTGEQVLLESISIALESFNAHVLLEYR